MLRLLAVYVPTLVLCGCTSPSPVHNGGAIGERYVAMQAQYSPGSCLNGTFVSADIQALAIPNIRVRPDAEFWPHHAVAQDWDGNPWHIEPESTQAVLQNLPGPLRADISSRLPNNSTFAFHYTGRELIARFGYKAC